METGLNPQEEGKIAPSPLAAMLDRTERYMSDSGYRGYDPYDGLESPLFKLPLLRRARIPRWGFQQVLKRIPFQTRPLFGIPKGYNPVTLALAIQGLVSRDQADQSGKKSRRVEVEKLVDELERLRSSGFSGACWGYDFHWEARYAAIPAWHPTVVATGFVTNALFKAYLHYGLESARILCLEAVSFVLNDLNRTLDGDTFCWSYSPSDNQVVLNATMKGARLLAQAVHLGADPACLEDAAATIRFVVSRQAENGSWPYSIGDTRSWADHFHTCYNLDCMDEYQALTGDHSFQAALEKGVGYYSGNFFTEEGIPRYFDKETYPIDATCCGQSLLTLVRFGKLQQARQTKNWIEKNMALPDGSFKYQIHRRFENQLPYMRWSTGWLFAGLASLENELSQQDSSITTEKGD